MALPHFSLAQGAAVLGAISHAAYFIHGEHHTSAPRLFAAAIFVPIVTFTGLVKVVGVSSNEAVQTTASLFGGFVGALWTSILIYRAIFHRLKGFPGPPMAKLTKLWHVLKVSKRVRNFETLDELHHKYGDYVRTGR